METSYLPVRLTSYPSRMARLPWRFCRQIPRVFAGLLVEISKPGMR